jgi:hypothetical protein
MRQPPSSRFLLSMLFLTACGTTTQFAATNPAPRPLTARPAQSVTVFATGLPDRPFVEVGIIQARQSSEFSVDEMPEILAEMRGEAAKQGCDGLVINGTRDAQSSSTTMTRHAVTSSSKTLEGFWGACIVFVVDPEPIAASAREPIAEAPVTSPSQAE